MALTTDIDVKIGYVENRSFFTTPKNILCFVEDRQKCTANVGVYYIDSSEKINSYIIPSQNPSAVAFNNTFFNQTVRPRGYYLVVGDFSGGASTLATGSLGSFASFRERFQNEQADLKGLAFKLIVSDDGDTKEMPIGIDPVLFGNMQNYNQLATALDACTGIIKVNIFANNNQLFFQSQKLGTTSQVKYLEPITQNYDVPTQIMTGDLPAWDDFVNALNGNTGNIIVKDSDGNQKQIEINPQEATNWNDFFIALDGRYGKNTNLGIFLIENVNDIVSVENEENPPADFVGLLRLKEENGAVWGAKATLTAENQSNTPVLMEATQDSGATIIDGYDNILGTPRVMVEINNILAKNNIRSSAICLSRNIYSIEANDMDIGTIINYAQGFGANFARNGNAPTTMLSLFINEATLADADQLSALYDQEYARDVIINYSSNEEYLDGAIAAYIAGVNYASEDVCRNTKGLVFNGITPESSMTNTEAEDLKDKRINFYSILENNVRMYREGQTLSRGEAGYIDISMGLNAIIKDMTDAMIRTILTGKLKMNAAGSAMIYGALANVCQTYVISGFLSPTVQSIIDEGGEHEVPVPAYKIHVAKKFNQAQITSRNYPDTWVELASTIFANTISIKLNSAYMLV